jgi:diguanylate cyclase (GGDEF)-like protein
MRNNRPSAALYELLEEVSSSNGLAETLGVLNHSLRRLLPFDALAVFLPREEQLTLAYVSGEEPRAACDPRVPVGQAIAGQVSETHRPAFNLDPRLKPGLAGEFRSMIAVPLEDGADMAGVLALYSADVHTFQPADLGVLLWIREDLARAVKHALRQAPADPAVCDLLTGLPNERGFFQRLDADLKRCHRQLRTLALLLCGVDGLAEVGARFGDQARKRLVQAIAAALRRTNRKGDCVARLGDEFALLLEEFPETAFDSKRSSIAALVVGVGVAQLGERPLAVRVGAAYFPDDAGDAEGLLSAAAARQRAAAPVPDSLTEDLERLIVTMELV